MSYTSLLKWIRKFSLLFFGRECSEPVQVFKHLGEVSLKPSGPGDYILGIFWNHEFSFLTSYRTIWIIYFTLRGLRSILKNWSTLSWLSNSRGWSHPLLSFGCLQCMWVISPDVYNVCSNIFCIIPDIANLYPFFFSLASNLPISLIFSKNQLSIDFLRCFPVRFHWILLLSIFFPSFCLL